MIKRTRLIIYYDAIAFGITETWLDYRFIMEHCLVIDFLCDYFRTIQIRGGGVLIAVKKGISGYSEEQLLQFRRGFVGERRAEEI